MTEKENKVLTTKEACEYLRISKPTFFNLIHKNQIRARKIGNRWRVSKSELRGFLEVKQQESKHKRTEQCYRKDRVVDAIDHSFLQILSLYPFDPFTALVQARRALCHQRKVNRGRNTKQAEDPRSQRICRKDGKARR
jgi:excisionase family DNA binding protein